MVDLTVGRSRSNCWFDDWAVGLTVKLCKHWLDSRCNYWSNWKSLANQWAERRLVTLVISHTAAALWGEVCAMHVLPMRVGFYVQIWRERNCCLPIYWYHLKGNWLRYNFAADSFYIMKLCNRLLVLYCRNCPKDDKFRYLSPILRKLGSA